MPFKHVLILLRYTLTDSVFFLSLLFHIQYNCYSKNDVLLLAYNNFFLHVQKDS